MMVALGGAFVSLNVPAPWANIQNPAQVQANTSLPALAEYYNMTLTWTAQGEYSNVSFALGTFAFVNISPRVNQSAIEANGEIGSINASIPLAIAGLQNATQLLSSKDYPDALVEIGRACSASENASKSLGEFANVTTPKLSKLGVPTNMYSVGLGLVKGEVSGLLSRCSELSGEASNLTSFVIGSPQTQIETGGDVVISGNLSANGAGVAGQEVTLFLNGTNIGTVSSGIEGIFSANFTIPFVYEPVVSIWAVAPKNASIGFSGAVSNTLYFAIVYNETQIVLKDPPAYLPTQNFTVEGSLSTKSGTPLPGAPVKITFFNSSEYTSTNSDGAFQTELTVPANASDGTYFVYAAFAPQGVYGPSFNLTSIQVYHEPLEVTLQAPPVSYAGFGSSLIGSVSANGTMLPNASVSLSSPWGVLRATSDSSGRFSFDVHVPVWEFGFAKNLSVSASPSQPYVSSGQMNVKLGLFNVLWIVLPGLGVVIGAYEVNSLGLFPKIGSRRRGAKLSEEQVRKSVDETIGRIVPRDARPHRMISIYRSALGVVVSRFGVSFKDSSTMREISSRVAKLAGSDSETAGLFYDVSLAAEDYVYSDGFDEGRVEEAEEKLSELRKRWA